MIIKSLAVFGLLAASLAFVPTIGLAQTLNTDTFTTACNGNADFLSGAQGDKEGLGRLCGCLATAFVEKNISQADIDVLTKDLDGTATPETQSAYETYEDLSAFAGQALNDCLVTEGFIDGSDPAAQ